MEEETVSKRFSTFRSIFNFSKLYKLNFRRQNFFTGIKTSRILAKGFTLVELLVVIAMIAILASLLFLFFNPIKQIEKAKDAQREQNLKQVNTALDTYYNDTNCYPTSFSFGGSWQQGSVSYLQKVPQDPDCAGGGPCFSYISDGTSSCPQWNILFTKIYNKTSQSSLCALEQIPSCLPSNYSSSGYNFCVLSGKVDCAYVSSLALPANAGAGTGTSSGGGGGGGSGGGGGGGGSGGGGSCSKDYACTGNPVHCNIISPAGTGDYCTSNCNGVCQ